MINLIGVRYIYVKDKFNSYKEYRKEYLKQIRDRDKDKKNKLIRERRKNDLKWADKVRRQAQKIRNVAGPTRFYLGQKITQLQRRHKAGKVKTCTLTREELLELIPKDLKCPIFKKPFKFNCHSQWNLSIDRINNDKGYDKDNVIIVSKKANQMKSNATLKEMYMVADFYYELEKKQLDK